MRVATTEQVAEYMGLQPNTLEQWRCTNLGPPYMVVSPRCIRYDLDAVDDYMRQTTIVPRRHV